MNLVFFMVEFTLTDVNLTDELLPGEGPGPVQAHAETPVSVRQDAAVL